MAKKKEKKRRSILLAETRDGEISKRFVVNALKFAALAKIFWLKKEAKISTMNTKANKKNRVPLLSFFISSLTSLLHIQTK